MADQLTKDGAVQIATADAAKRAGVDASAVRVESVESTTFPNSALGAARPGEMSADMMASGWTVRVSAGGRAMEYRANARQVRLVNFDGNNHVVYPS